MGAAPSRQAQSLFSYFRGSYEIGLIPLTKHYFGKDDADTTDSTPAEIFVKVHFSDTTGQVGELFSRQKYVKKGEARCEHRRHLREQLLHMRSDPAVLYSNARDDANMRASAMAYLKALWQHAKSEGAGSGTDKEAGMTGLEEEEVAKQAGEMPFTPSEEEVDKVLAEHYWDIMPQANFTEADLDAFLDLVEEQMYDTDVEMAGDPAYQEGAQREEVAASSPPKTRRTFMPIPCALCLAYPEGKERPGCFLLEGRNINIIGYFGLMTEDMQAAFRVIKRSSADGEEGGTAAKASTESPSGEGEGNPKLYLNTAILTSAGDRTLERVLVLAAVMLRQQFHTACYRALLSAKLAHPASVSDGTNSATTPQTILFRIVAPGGTSVESISDVCCRAAVETFLATPLPRLPSSMVSLQPSGRHSKGSSDNNAQTMLQEGCNACRPPYVARRLSFYISTGDSVSPLRSSHHVVISKQEEESISWGLHRRLNSIDVVIEMACNNYSALKSLTENFAFLQLQLQLDPGDSRMELIDMPKSLEEHTVGSTEANTQQHCTSYPQSGATLGEEADPCDLDFRVDDCVSTDEDNDRDEPAGPSNRAAANESHFELSSSSAVMMYVKPRLFCQAALWASNLFHYPTRLRTGNWVQYKLKDECDHLRHTLQNKDTLIAQWRQEKRQHAATYLGPQTSLLLSHVRILQEETEDARRLPPDHWKALSTFVNQEGRKYALHRWKYGTMLFGVRTHQNRYGNNDYPVAAPNGQALHGRELAYRPGEEKLRGKAGAQDPSSGCTTPAPGLRPPYKQPWQGGRGGIAYEQSNFKVDAKQPPTSGTEKPSLPWLGIMPQSPMGGAPTTYVAEQPQQAYCMPGGSYHTMANPNIVFHTSNTAGMMGQLPPVAPPFYPSTPVQHVSTSPNYGEPHMYSGLPSQSCILPGNYGPTTLVPYGHPQGGPVLPHQSFHVAAPHGGVPLLTSHLPPGGAGYWGECVHDSMAAARAASVPSTPAASGKSGAPPWQPTETKVATPMATTANHSSNTSLPNSPYHKQQAHVSDSPVGPPSSLGPWQMVSSPDAALAQYINNTANTPTYYLMGENTAAPRTPPAMPNSILASPLSYSQRPTASNVPAGGQSWPMAPTPTREETCGSREPADTRCNVISQMDGQIRSATPEYHGVSVGAPRMRNDLYMNPHTGPWMEATANATNYNSVMVNAPPPKGSVVLSQVNVEQQRAIMSAPNSPPPQPQTCMPMMVVQPLTMPTVSCASPSSPQVTTYLAMYGGTPVMVHQVSGGATTIKPVSLGNVLPQDVGTFSSHGAH